MDKELLKEALQALEEVGLQDCYINYQFVFDVKKKLQAAIDAPDVAVVIKKKKSKAMEPLPDFIKINLGNGHPWAKPK